MASIASTIRRDIKSFGVIRTAYMALMKGVNSCFMFTIIKVFKNEVADPDFLETNNSFRWRFLDESQMLELGRDPENWMCESEVQAALEKGDECYAGFDGDKLACFGWFSTQPTTRIGITTSPGPDYIYTYGAFTHPRYRGLRLTASRGARARREYLARGFKGTMFSVESHNFQSLRAVCASPDIRPVGYFLVIKIGKLGWVYNSRGMREHGVHSAFHSPARELVPAAS